MTTITNIINTATETVSNAWMAIKNAVRGASFALETKKLEREVKKEQKKAAREAKVATWPKWAQFLYNFGAGLFGSSTVGVGLFIGGMTAAMAILMVIGVYFDIDFIIETIYGMADFYAAIGAGTFSIDTFGADTIMSISNFVLISMCLGYIPTFIYMFTKRDLDGGYGQKIDACELFKWTAVFYAVNLLLEVIINGLAPLPIFTAATADLASVNLLATEGNLFMCLLTTGILAPIAEEISLRFMVQKGMTRAGEKFAIFWSALIFGILHMNLFQSTYAFLMGLLICFIYYKTNYNLWYTTIIHVVNNSIAVLISQTGVNAYVAYTVLPLVFFGVYYIMNQKNKSVAEASAYLKANYSAQLN